MRKLTSEMAAQRLAERAAYMRAYNRRRAAQKRSYMRDYRECMTEKQQGLERQAKERWSARNLVRSEVIQKRRARAAVNNAIMRWRLFRPDRCEICGVAPGKGRNGISLLHAHHWRGYGKEHWLDVQWVCSTCDGEIEQQNRGSQWAA